MDISTLSTKARQAIKLVDCGTRSQLTHTGNVIVSSQAKRLKAAGLITEAPERWIAYELTTAGRAALDELLRLEGWEPRK